MPREKNVKFLHAKELIETLAAIDPLDNSQENIDRLHFGQKCAWCESNATLWLLINVYKELRKLNK